MGAGLGVESSIVKSSGTDVEDVLKVELGGPVENPGTTMGTYFLTTSPLIGVSVIFAEFSKRQRNAGES